MESPGIEAVLAKAEARVSEGGGLDGIGFWPAVARVKGNRELAERYGARIAAIDDAAFRQWAVLVVPFVPGAILASIAAVAGVAAIGWSYYLDGLVAVVVFYLGLVALFPSTHALAHLLVGRLLGIGFTAWFVGSWRRPQPGIKFDYESYLLAPARHRAWMHAAGAITTKLLPLALLGAAVAAGLPTWAVWGLVVVFVVSVLFDVFWSTKSSDWKRFKREMARA
jgi:hypothetical protein